MEYYLDPLVIFFNNISLEQRNEIQTSYGSGGKAKVWRTFEKVIADARPDFRPEGLAEFLRDNTKQFNVESFSMVRDLENIIKADFKQKLSEKYGDKWTTLGIPQKVYKQANSIMGKHNYANSISGIDKKVTLWDCVTLSNCRDISIYGPNWPDLFEKAYTRPTDYKKVGGRAAKTEWLLTLSKIANASATNYSVT